MTTTAAEPPFPVLRLRANGPTGMHVTEIRLGDIDLFTACIVSDVKVHIPAQGVATATITFEVTPDIELPAAYQPVVPDDQADG